MAFGFEFHLLDAQRHRGGGESPRGVFPFGVVNRRSPFGSTHHDLGPPFGRHPPEHCRAKRDSDHQAAHQSSPGEPESAKEEGGGHGGDGDEDERTEEWHVEEASDSEWR